MGLNNHKIMKMCDPPPPHIHLNTFTGVLRPHYQNDDLSASVRVQSKET